MNINNLDKISNNNFREAVIKAYSRFTRIRIRADHGKEIPVRGTHVQNILARFIAKHFWDMMMQEF